MLPCARYMTFFYNSYNHFYNFFNFFHNILKNPASPFIFHALLLFFYLDQYAEYHLLWIHNDHYPIWILFPTFSSSFFSTNSVICFNVAWSLPFSCPHFYKTSVFQMGGSGQIHLLISLLYWTASRYRAFPLSTSTRRNLRTVRVTTLWSPTHLNSSTTRRPQNCRVT